MTVSRRHVLGLAAGAAVGVAVPTVAAAKKPPSPPGKPPKPTPTPTTTAPPQTYSHVITDRALGEDMRNIGLTVGTPPTGTLIFDDDFSTGDFDKWQTCQWNSGGTIFNSNCSGYDGTSMYSAAVVNEGTAGHEACARFELRNGDIPFSTTERTEITAFSSVDVVQGDIRRMEWDMKFASTWTVAGSSNWCIPMQWHGSGSSSSPPLCLDLDSSDVIRLCNNDASGLQRTVIGTITKNVWQHWRIDSLFHPTAGWAQVWIDGVSVLAQHTRATMVPGEGSNYLKMGIYRDPVNTATGILWHDNVAIYEP